MYIINIKKHKIYKFDSHNITIKISPYMGKYHDRFVSGKSQRQNIQLFLSPSIKKSIICRIYK